MATSTAGSRVASPIAELGELGQSVWLDNIHRALLHLGRVRADGARGRAERSDVEPVDLREGDRRHDHYDEALADCVRLRCADGLGDQAGVREPGDRRPARRRPTSCGRSTTRPAPATGTSAWRSAPDLAHDTAGTVAEARRLWASVDRPNLMIKVPGTEEGIPAIRELIAGGINVNVTLLFSTAVYEQVVEAYLAGLEDRLGGGGEARPDQLGRELLRQPGRLRRRPSGLARPLQGKTGIANAKIAYARFRVLFAGGRWRRCAPTAPGKQRLLWASTSTKNPAYSDVLYVESLIGPDTIDTIYRRPTRRSRRTGGRA